MPSVQGTYIPSLATRYVSAAAEQKKVLKNGAGLLHAAVVTNVQAAARWLFVFDNNTDSGALVIPPLQIPAGGFVSIDMPSLPFPAGCTFASSTGVVYVAGGADLLILAFTS